MAYTAWSVVYGEQPTAAKWNQLGANDAGFKDATNIDSNVISKAKLTTGVKALGDYSTSEVATEFTWIDGRTIYKRTFSGTISQSAGARNTVTLIASGIDKVIDYEGYYDEGGSLFVALGSARMATDGTVNGSDTVWVLSNAVALLTKSAVARTNAPYVVTIYYLK